MLTDVDGSTLQCKEAIMQSHTRLFAVGGSIVYAAVNISRMQWMLDGRVYPKLRSHPGMMALL